MSSEGEKATGLVPSPSSALSRAGSKSLVQRGMQDLIARAGADQWRKQGLALYKQRQFGEAYECFRRGLHLAPNDADLQFRVGEAYANAEPTVDRDRAAFWYRKAADQGHAIAQLFLGCAYEDGAGVPEDDEQAAFWFRKAANQGDATGQFMLAEMFLEGRGVPQDPEQAVSWYSKAADQGDSNAKIELGKIYEAGIVPQDPQQAARWYREAEVAETADRIPPPHLWQGRESRVLTLKAPRGIEKWHLVDGRPRFLVSVREKGSAV